MLTTRSQIGRAVCFGFLLSILSMSIGCSTSDLQIPNGQGGTIDLSGLTSSATGSTSSSGSTATAPSSTPASPSTLPAPASTTTAPSSPTASTQINPTSVDSQAAISELSSTYGISVSGSYTDKSILNCILSARQLLPEDTKGIKIKFTDQNAGGVMGMWSSSGSITIYSPAKTSLTTVFHEIIHHCTLYRESGHGAQVAAAVVTAIGKGNNPKNFPASVITRSYAQTMIEEFWAEIFSVYRIKKYGLGGSTAGFTGTFNPPESLRPTINNMYASNP